MPINLKAVLLQHGLKHSDMAREVLQANGTPLSTAAVSLLLNWGNFPKNTPEFSIRRQTEDFLRSKSVLESDIATLWSDASTDLYRRRTAHDAPAIPHRRGSPCGCPAPCGCPQEVTPEIDPIGEPEMLSANAKKLFSLFRDPFSDDVQGPDDIFLSADQRYIREAMLSTAKHGGFLAVVGESGAGKSVLRKDLLDRIVRESQDIIAIQLRSIDKSKITERAIFEAIIYDLDSGAKLKQSNESNTRQAQSLLRMSLRAGNTHVLIIEEAHGLSTKTLKYLKQFYELEDESGFKKLLSIILIGQPELKSRLDLRVAANYEAREMIRRCEVAELLPLDRHLEDYLAFKFKRVGSDVAKVFEADAFDAIRAKLKGSVYPLIVNNFVNKAMNLAAEIGAKKISAEVIKEL